MGDGRLDEIEMAVVLRTVFEFVNVKIFEMVFTLKSVLSRPALSNLLKQHVAFRSMPMATGRFGAVVAQRVIRKRPSLQMPMSRLSVRSADFCSIPFDQRADSRVAVHCLEHLQAGAVQANDGKVVIERRKPPFVGMMLIGDQI